MVGHDMGNELISQINRKKEAKCDSKYLFGKWYTRFSIPFPYKLLAAHYENGAHLGGGFKMDPIPAPICTDI